MKYDKQILIDYFKQSLNPEVIDFDEIYGDEYKRSDFLKFIDFLMYGENKQVEDQLKKFIIDWKEDIEVYREFNEE